jgi:hypothetical protein
VQPYPAAGLRCLCSAMEAQQVRRLHTLWARYSRGTRVAKSLSTPCCSTPQPTTSSCPNGVKTRSAGSTSSLRSRAWYGGSSCAACKCSARRPIPLPTGTTARAVLHASAHHDAPIPLPTGTTARACRRHGGAGGHSDRPLIRVPYEEPKQGCVAHYSSCPARRRLALCSPRCALGCPLRESVELELCCRPSR